jgi:NAD(P)-dependent dehydrogenase (short-subunit alcohol dehydrogenase family)
MKLCEGRIALVTGGSKGLGRAICTTLAREGAHVAFNWQKSEAEAKETLAAIEAHGVRGFSFRVSVLDKQGLAGAVKTVEEAVGTIDVLVNNAGVVDVVPVALMEEEDWDRVMDTNVKGAFLATQAVLRGMVKQKRGRILNIGSLAGVKMMHAPVHYSTAKAALKGFTESLAKEIGRYGITVNNLAPGVLETGVSVHLPKGRLEEYLRHCALGRMGTLDEVAEVAAFLVSERSSYINGATIVVDGAV